MLRRIEGFDFVPGSLSDSERERIFSAKGYYTDHYGLYNGTGRFSSGNCLTYNSIDLGNKVVGLRIPTGVAVATGFQGIAVKVPSTGGVRHDYLSLFDGVNNTSQILFKFQDNGIIGLYRGSGSGGYGESGATLIGRTDIAAYQEDQWFYLEWGATIAAGTGGSCEARVNTKTVLDFPAINTDHTGRGLYDMVAMGNWYGGSAGGVPALNLAYDDFYMCDDTGSENNTFLGNCRVMTQQVAGNSTPQDFAIGGSAPAATAWQSLLNTNLDDTKYIYDGTAGHESLFTVQAIVNSPAVFGIQVSGAYRMDDATQRVVHNVIKSGATASEGADQYINQTYTYYRDIWETNPDTGVGFTGSELNSLLTGAKVAV